MLGIFVFNGIKLILLLICLDCLGRSVVLKIVGSFFCRIRWLEGFSR